MIRKFTFISLGMILLASCLSPAEKCSGTYHGQYVNNAFIDNNGTATVTKENENSISVTLSAATISSVTISGISITTSGDNFSLVKTGIFESLGGSVNGNELTISYGYIGGAITFTGTK